MFSASGNGLAGTARGAPGACKFVAVIGAAVLAACAAVPEARELGVSNTVTWSTASESDNFGFDVYRSRSRDGRFERISNQPLVGGGTTDLPRDYRFVDDDIEIGTEYFYYVESISLSGERQRFTPVMRAPAKYPADQ